MSYPMNEDQELLVEAINEFCTRADVVEAAEADRANFYKFPENSWQKMVDQGLFGLSIPEEYGGQGQTVLTEMMAYEALLKNGNPTTNSYAGHCLGMQVLRYWGTPEVKEKYLPKVASGEFVCAGSATDPAGSFNHTEWGITYTETDDGYLINGSKVMCTNAERADVRVVFGREPGSPYQNVAFVIEKDTPGMSVGEQEQRIVPGVSDWASLSFDNVLIPKENLLRRDPVVKNNWLALGFNMGAMLALRLGQASFEMAFDYTSKRTNSGRPLNQLQSVAHRLMDMAIRNEIAQSSIYTASALWVGVARSKKEGHHEKTPRQGSHHHGLHAWHRPRHRENARGTGCEDRRLRTKRPGRRGACSRDSRGGRHGEVHHARRPEHGFHRQSRRNHARRVRRD